MLAKAGGPHMRKASFLQPGATQIKRFIRATLRRYGYQLSRSGELSVPPDDELFRSLAPGSTSQKFTIALVGTLKSGLYGVGKASPMLYFPKFAYALSKLGVSLIAYRDPADVLHNIDNHDPARTAFILIYNEDFQRELLPNFADLTANTKFLFYNAPSAGEIMGDKRATSRVLIKAGIPVPPMADTEATSKVFSNVLIGSHEATAVIDIGVPLDTDRYNTLFIDTAHDYKGKSYYIALRTLAVTGTMISAYARARPTGEAEASVHASDTPKDPDLISHFHETLVEANRPRLCQLCEKIGKILGPGFYSHDILPSRETGQLFVCETGFKFDDQDYREALWPISSDLPFLIDHFTVAIADLAAEAIAEQCFGEALKQNWNKKNQEASHP
jgi:hypothetical protein